MDHFVRWAPAISHMSGAGKDHPALRAALAELMEASKEFRAAYLDGA